MKKPWILESPPPPEDVDYSSLSKSRRAEWMNSLNSKGEDMLYTISAFGDVAPKDVDVLHTSAAAHMASIKRRRRKARNGGTKSKRNTMRLSPEEMSAKVVGMEAKVNAEKALDEVGKDSKRLPYSLPPTSPTPPIVINTVEDLLRILAERGLGSVPPSPAPSANQEDTSVSDAESEATLVSTPFECGLEKEDGLQIDVGFELVEEAVKSIRKKFDLPADHKAVRDVEKLFAYLSAPRQKATTLRRSHEDAARAIDRARHASLKRFLAYHDFREKERDSEGGVGCAERNQAQWATFVPNSDGKASRTNASVILKESIKLNKPPARVRKPIPTWF